MELYVNPTITDFRQDVNGDIKMLKIGVKKEDAYANIIGQAEGADLDNNKTKTINVSTYTEPVEVLPTAGKDGMKKATITLSNIPSTNSVTFYAWADEDSPTLSWGVTLSETPSVNDNVFGLDRDGCPNYENTNAIVSVGENTITIEYDGEPFVLTRLSDGDLTYPKSSS